MADHEAHCGYGHASGLCDPHTLATVMHRALTGAVVALVAAFAIAACSAEPSDGEFGAAESVFAGEIIVAPASSGVSATLSVTTAMDMACAVVYGRTPELGDGIATDTDMAGGAHADHEVVLTGLEPGTEYYYRVQGSGSDGRLYRSELMTFQTPDAEDERPGENVAAGATVVGVSSEFSGAFAAQNAVDGDPATEWSSAGDGDDAWITIDLGEAVDIVGIGFYSRQMGDGTSIVESFTVTADDGVVLGPFPAGPGMSYADVEVTGQVLRFDAVETTGGNTGAVEIEVYQ